MKINEWIREARKQAGLTQERLGEALGRTKGNISSWEKGLHSPSLQQIISISEITGTPLPNDLFMKDREQIPSKIISITPDQEPESNVVMAYDRIALAEDLKDFSAYTEVDLYDVKLSAGHGVSWMPKQEEPLVFRTAWLKKRGFSEEDCKGMYVRGDSMEPTILNWDTVLIDTSDTELVTGEIYAIAYKDKFFLKEVRVRPDSIELISRNTKYDPIIVPDNEADKFQVLGRMVWRGG